MRMPSISVMLLNRIAAMEGNTVRSLSAQSASRSASLELTTSSSCDDCSSSSTTASDSTARPADQQEQMMKEVYRATPYTETTYLCSYYSAQFLYVLMAITSIVLIIMSIYFWTHLHVFGMPQGLSSFYAATWLLFFNIFCIIVTAAAYIGTVQTIVEQISSQMYYSRLDNLFTLLELETLHYPYSFEIIRETNPNDDIIQGLTPPTISAADADKQRYISVMIADAILRVIAAIFLLTDYPRTYQVTFIRNSFYSKTVQRLWLDTRPRWPDRMNEFIRLYVYGKETEAPMPYSDHYTRWQHLVKESEAVLFMMASFVVFVGMTMYMIYVPQSFIDAPPAGGDHRLNTLDLKKQWWELYVNILIILFTVTTLLLIVFNFMATQQTGISEFTSQDDFALISGFIDSWPFSLVIAKGTDPLNSQLASIPDDQPAIALDLTFQQLFIQLTCQGFLALTSSTLHAYGDTTMPIHTARETMCRFSYKPLQDAFDINRTELPPSHIEYIRRYILPRAKQLRLEWRTQHYYL